MSRYFHSDRLRDTGPDQVPHGTSSQVVGDFTMQPGFSASYFPGLFDAPDTHAIAMEHPRAPSRTIFPLLSQQGA
jgi:hypothetical protein